MKSKVIAICGESGAGKDLIAKTLIEKYGWHFAVSLTTRKPRLNEIDGVDYHFITNKEFNKKFDNGELFEKASYISNNKLLQYGLSRESFKDNVINIAIVNPKGLDQLLKTNLKDKLIIFKIEATLEQRIMRYLNRDNINDNQKIQLVDRLKQDFEDFDEFYNKYNFYKINNNDDKNIEDVCDKIMSNIIWEVGEY